VRDWRRRVSAPGQQHAVRVSAPRRSGRRPPLGRTWPAQSCDTRLGHWSERARLTGRACPCGAQRHITIYETLKRIGDAETRALDVWSVSITCGARGPCQR